MEPWRCPSASAKGANVSSSNGERHLDVYADIPSATWTLAAENGYGFHKPVRLWPRIERRSELRQTVCVGRLKHSQGAVAVFHHYRCISPDLMAQGFGCLN